MTLGELVMGGSSATKVPVQLYNDLCGCMPVAVDRQICCCHVVVGGLDLCSVGLVVASDWSG